MWDCSASWLHLSKSLTPTSVRTRWSVQSERDDSRAACKLILHGLMYTKRSFAFAMVMAVGVMAGGCKKKQQDPEPVVATTTPPPTTTVQQSGDAVLQGDRIIIARPIYYDTDKDSIRPESFSVIDAVANVVNSH